MDPQDYLRAVAGDLGGSRGARTRLLTELRDHIEDSLEAEGRRAGEVMARLGAPGDVVASWQAHTAAVRAQNRRRAAVLALAVATTVALGIVQHASGHRTPHQVCSAAPSSHAGPGASRRPTGCRSLG
ncbi:MAG: hypothetical protein HOQ28_12495 [Thermoleophilia bacterium]|nr:hypothetical protein [Thermoleophilia bacterium]